jgi:hypothetical protein
MITPRPDLTPRSERPPLDIGRWQWALAPIIGPLIKHRLKARYDARMKRVEALMASIRDCKSRESLESLLGPPRYAMEGHQYFGPSADGSFVMHPQRAPARLGSWVLGTLRMMRRRRLDPWLLGFRVAYQSSPDRREVGRGGRPSSCRPTDLVSVACVRRNAARSKDAKSRETEGFHRARSASPSSSTSVDNSVPPCDRMDGKIVCLGGLTAVDLGLLGEDRRTMATRRTHRPEYPCDFLDS